MPSESETQKDINDNNPLQPNTTLKHLKENEENVLLTMAAKITVFFRMKIYNYAQNVVKKF